jgi:GNAT superfamily N-acetyltransferase
MVEQTYSPLEIRYATHSDSRLLAEVGAETFAATFAADNSAEDMAAYLSEAFNTEQQARELADPASRFLIVEAAGQTAGYAHVKFGEAPAAIEGRRPMEIARLYARQHWLGKGVGARLMEACLHEAMRAGCDVVWLGVWERNTRAIAFYRRWGFVEAGTHMFRLGEDLQRDLLMARDATHPPAQGEA